jgi:hypothetical protein
VCAGVALVAYLIAAVGFPIPAAPLKTGGVAYPCQNHPCGCQSAEQCWRSCCCFTVEERWAWARANNVEPPAYAARPAQSDPAAPKSWSTTRLRDRAEGRAAASHACPDCAAQAALERRTPAEQGPQASAADARPSRCCDKDRPTSPSAPSGATRWVCGRAALGCQGLGSHWITCGAVTPPPAHLTWQSYPAPPTWLSLPRESPLCLSLTPPDPPPRFTHS